MARKVTLDQLMDAISLEDIVFVDFAARRTVDADQADENAGDDADIQIEGHPKINIQPVLVDDGKRLGLLVSAGVLTPEINIDVRLELRYALDPAIPEISDDVMGEFLGRSALLTVLPYVREFVQSSAMRLRVPAPLIQLGKPAPLSKNSASD